MRKRARGTDEPPTNSPPAYTPAPQCNAAPADVITAPDWANITCDGAVSLLGTQFFYDHLLPKSPLPAGQSVKDIVIKLLTTGDIQKTNPSYWTNWKKPSDCLDHQADVFRKLEQLTMSIRDAADIKTTMTTELVCNGAIPLESDTRNNTSKPDCYAIRCPEAKSRFVQDSVGKYQPLWLDVAVPGEFRKSSRCSLYDDDMDTASKMMWSVNHIMREDARRRFVIGFSIDDCDMRLWYFSRSDAYVSEPFNFLTDHELFVDFVLRISYASYTQLGWDPTITLRPLKDGQQLEYDVEVAEVVDEEITIRKFRTVRLLSNIGAEALHSRGTRVWEVAELDDSDQVRPGNTVVLKDSWVDQDRDREGKIIADVLQAAKARGEDSLEHKTMKKFLLTTVTFGDVHIDGEVDTTRCLPLPEVTKEVEIKADPSVVCKAASTQTLAVAGTTSVEQTPQMVHVKRYSTKIHHRIVFREVGKTIREITSLRQGFSCLSQIVLALRILHSLGWVHRDVSCGNVLIAGDSAKLADLEYAKREEDTSPHGIRIGTSYFMSVEVDSQSYLYRPVNVPDDKTEQADKYAAQDAAWFDEPLYDAENLSGDDLETTLPSLLPSTISIKKVTTRTPFRHNPLHDLESIFWLGLYILFVGTLVKEQQTARSVLANQTLVQKDFAIRLFRNPAFRFAVVLPNVFREELNEIPLNPRIRLIAKCLDELLKVIRSAFVRAEKDPATPIPFAVAEDLNVYKKIKKSLDDIKAILTPHDITVALDEASTKQLKQANLSENPISPDNGLVPYHDGSPSKRRRTNAGASILTSSRTQAVPTRSSARTSNSSSQSGPAT